MRFLRLIWPAVLQGRRRAAWSARNFFDLERARVTGLPQLDVPLLPDYRFEFFVNDMKPAFDMAVKQIRAVRELEKVGRPAPAPRIESTVRVAVAKVVADAGRDQMIEAVEADAKKAEKAKADAIEVGRLAAAEARRKRLAGERTATFDDQTLNELQQILAGEQQPKNLRESRKEVDKKKKELRAEVEREFAPVELDNAHPEVVGWARVATGEETCSWCLMLVSREPKYVFADTALTKRNSKYRYAESTIADAYRKVKDKSPAEITDAMAKYLPDDKDRFHTGCDCVVVPIFDTKDWTDSEFGRREAAARKVWDEAATGFEYDKTKKYRTNPGTKDYQFNEIQQWDARTRYALNRIRQAYAGKIRLDVPRDVRELVGLP
jgi:hypothetical protein